tara:strand:+ start:943 stop:1203 length:261 start_codon:yes stop_codon:yes gene_type:complete
MKHTISCVVIILFCSLFSKSNLDKNIRKSNFSKELMNLASWMDGSFSSFDQSLKDSSVDNIRPDYDDDRIETSTFDKYEVYRMERK